MIDRLITPLKDSSFFLFGARAVGKSTILRERFASQAYLSVNLLNDDEYYSLSQRPDSIVERVRKAPPKSLIIIDEVQRVPNLLNVVHLLIEENDLIFILSGSSSRKLKRGNANLLAGRALLYELYPLTYLELKEDFDLQSALDWGTLPSLTKLTSRELKIEYLHSYVDTYLKEEIVAEQLIRQLPPFRRFLDVAAQMNTKILNYSSIGRDVGVTPDTIKEYFAILEETYIGVILPAYSRSIRKQQTQAPKFYFFDCGVPRAILRTNESALNESTSLYGDTFEQHVILEFIRLNSYFKKRAKFSYLRTKDGAEIDLIVELPNKDPILVEIKSARTIYPEDLGSFKTLAADMKHSGAYCLSRDSFEKEIGPITSMSWDKGILKILGVSSTI